MNIWIILIALFFIYIAIKILFSLLFKSREDREFESDVIQLKLMSKEVDRISKSLFD